MYAITSLSPYSQDFIKTVNNPEVIKIAVAKVIANRLPLPSFELADHREYYTTTAEQQAKGLVSKFNEVTVINTGAVLSLVESFWKARYCSVFPPKVLIQCETDAMCTFMGVAQVIDADTCKFISENAEALRKAINGFTSVIDDLTKAAKQEQDNSNDLVAVSESFNLAAYSRRYPVR